MVRNWSVMVGKGSVLIRHRSVIGVRTITDTGSMIARVSCRIGPERNSIGRSIGWVGLGLIRIIAVLLVGWLAGLQSRMMGIRRSTYRQGIGVSQLRRVAIVRYRRVLVVTRLSIALIHCILPTKHCSKILHY